MSATGWGSWMNMNSPSRSRFSAFHRFASRNCSYSSGVKTTGAPWRALCIFFVIRKKASLPLMTFQRAATPRFLRSGIIRMRISATPPPTAVELTFWIVRPFKRAAIRSRSSMTSRPTIGS